MGEFQLVKELYFDDHETFFKYFRMSPANFDYLLSLVGKSIERNPSSRGYVSPRERLAVTLRYSVLGFHNLPFTPATYIPLI